MKSTSIRDIFAKLYKIKINNCTTYSEFIKIINIIATFYDFDIFFNTFTKRLDSNKFFGIQNSKMEMKFLVYTSKGYSERFLDSYNSKITLEFSKLNFGGSSTGISCEKCISLILHGMIMINGIKVNNKS